MQHTLRLLAVIPRLCMSSFSSSGIKYGCRLNTRSSSHTSNSEKVVRCRFFFATLSEGVGSWSCSLSQSLLELQLGDDRELLSLQLCSVLRAWMEMRRCSLNTADKTGKTWINELKIVLKFLMQTLLRSSDAYRNEWTWAGAKRGEASTKTSLARNQKRDSSLTRHHEFHLPPFPWKAPKRITPLFQVIFQAMLSVTSR